jgi:hypothetical protein
MMTKAPPVPPANRSPKGPGGDPDSRADKAVSPKQSASDPDEKGRQANVKQNTTHQGYQQDR